MSDAEPAATVTIRTCASRNVPLDTTALRVSDKINIRTPKGESRDINLNPIMESYCHKRELSRDRDFVYRNSLVIHPSHKQRTTQTSPLSWRLNLPSTAHQRTPNLHPNLAELMVVRSQSRHRRTRPHMKRPNYLRLFHAGGKPVY